MSDIVFLSVLLAAFLHAAWNGLLKSSPNKLASMTSLMLGHLPLAFLGVWFSPFPPYEAWLWLLGSIFCHTCYQLFLVLSYRLGDYTQVYPLARGSAPVLVTFASLAFFGVLLSPFILFGIGLICCGLLFLATSKTDGLRNPRAVMSALCTGVFIALYSLLDGHGARAAGDAIGYISWMMIVNAILFGLMVCIYDKRVIVTAYKTERLTFWVGGSISIVAYILAVWAMTQAPIALVTALRETSVIFALFIGFLVMGERVTSTKIVAVLISVSGVVLLRLHG